MILDPDLSGSVHVHRTSAPGLMPGERAPGRLAAPWADADTMLIPKSMLEPKGSLVQRLRRRLKGFVVTVLASLGLSSQQADRTARRLSTIVAVLAACVVVVVALFADKWVTTRANEKSRDEARRARAHAAAAPSQAAAKPLSTTRITSSPEGAEVVVGGQSLGKTPFSVARGEQETFVLIRLQGYESQMVLVDATSPNELRVALQPSDEQAPSEAAKPTVPTP